MTIDEFYDNEVLISLLTPRAGHLQFIGLKSDSNIIDRYLFISGVKLQESYCLDNNQLKPLQSIPLLDEIPFESIKPEYDEVIEG